MTTRVSAPTSRTSPALQSPRANAERRDIEEILPTRRIGVEVADTVVAEAGREHERVGAGAAGHVVIVRPALEQIGALAAVKMILAIPTVNFVVAAIAIELVIPGAAVDLIGAIAAGDMVVVLAAVKVIVAFAALELVVAGGAEDHIVAISAIQVITADGADDRIIRRRHHELADDRRIERQYRRRIGRQVGLGVEGTPQVVTMS